MSTRRRPFAAAAALLCALGVSADAAPPRQGQVVRVERRRSAPGQGVHLCVQEAGRDYLLCLGPQPPRVGARISLLGLVGFTSAGPDRSGVAQVTRTEAAAEDRCSSGQLHAVHYRMDQAIGGSEVRLGLTGLDLPPSSRLEPPSGVALSGSLGGYAPVLGIDTDGSTGSEILMARRDCRERLGPSGGTAECFAYLEADGGDWKLLGEDAFLSCP